MYSFTKYLSSLCFNSSCVFIFEKFSNGRIDGTKLGLRGWSGFSFPMKCLLHNLLRLLGSHDGPFKLKNIRTLHKIRNNNQYDVQHFIHNTMTYSVRFNNLIHFLFVQFYLDFLGTNKISYQVNLRCWFYIRQRNNDWLVCDVPLPQSTCRLYTTNPFTQSTLT